MLRSLAVAALLALPLPAAASIGEGQPLRTLCSSPTMDYCMSIWSWDWSYSPGTEILPNGFASVRLNSKVEFFGSAIEAAGDWWALEFMATSFGDDYYMAVRDWNGPTNPDSGPVPRAGFYELEQSGASNLSIGIPSVHDNIAWFRAISVQGSIAAVCVTDDFQFANETPRCYEPVSVPEPASMLLLATGIGGVAIARRRRSTVGS